MGMAFDTFKRMLLLNESLIRALQHDAVGATWAEAQRTEIASEVTRARQVEGDFILH